MGFNGSVFKLHEETVRFPFDYVLSTSLTRREMANTPPQ